MITLLTPQNGAVLDTYTQLQQEYCNLIKSDGTDAANAWVKIAKNSNECSYPNVFTFEWTGGTAPYMLYLSEDETFSSPLKYSADEQRCEITNLKNGQTYFWRVNDSDVFTFQTTYHISRLLHIDGVKNVRDIGGVNIKQGMLFRGSQINGVYQITDAGRKTFCEELGIKTDLDLRGECFGKFDKSEAGESVAFVQMPYRAYSESFEDQHRKGICKIMEFLSDRDNYPVYVHCLGGADRTGMIALYLRALLGEDDDTIHTDYEFTSLSTYGAFIANQDSGFRSRNAPYYVIFQDMLNEYAPSQPMSVKVRAFLRDCGVSDECFDKIVAILKK